MPGRMVCALLAFLAGAAHAQLAGEFLDREPAQAARDAFDAQYGRLLVAEFGRILRASAEPRCLRATGIDPATLEARGHEMLVRTATKIVEIHAGVVDRKKLRSAFVALAGKDAWAEWEGLRGDPEVKRYLEVMEPARLARLADQVVDAVDKHAATKRFVLARKLSPLASGDAALKRANPYEGSLHYAQNLAQQSRSASLRRWLELSYRMAESLQQAANYDRVLRMGPQDLAPDVAADLANLCIPQR